MAGKIFNIPQSCSFTDVLAEKFSHLYEKNPAMLADLMFLLPSRRACLSLRDAFVRCNGLKPTLLPKILPIGELEEDEISLRTADAPALVKQLPAVVDDFERLFIFARLIVSKPAEYGLPEMTISQAVSLARDLAKLIDISHNEQIPFTKLKDLVPEQYAAHWQETLRFLQIITNYWPQILAERQAVDSAHRKNILLAAQAEIWQKSPPSGKIIAAGITAGFPEYHRLLKTILQLENGEVYLYGVDKYLNADDWAQIDESHPCYEQKKLLEFLQISREDVTDVQPPQNPLRERFVSEVMCPAAATSKWRNLQTDKISPKAITDLKTINCEDMRKEAAVIAVIMRETLNTPEKTAALVTTDRELARRVASELERWNIKIDDSAGRPLHLTPTGIFLRLIPFVIENNTLDTAWLSLAKNPFTRLGVDKNDLRRKIRDWEFAKRRPLYSDEHREIPEQLQDYLCKIKQAVEPLQTLYNEQEVDFTQLLQTHLSVAETLAASSDSILASDTKKTSGQMLWSGDDGRAAAAFFSRLLPQAETLGKIEPAQYASLLTILLSGQTVRTGYGTHPRLKILGPIEARFNHYDRVIIGEVNEGAWPALSSGDPWLSRPMKKDMGMSLPETAIGIMAADFSQLLCAPEVYLTRAARVNGTPMNKSRWLLRLETVWAACGFPPNLLENKAYLRLASQLYQPEKYVAIEAPAPCPPVSARPRRLSASTVETLMRDPYEIYASKILRLKPLNELDMKLSPSDYGNIVHHILEIFNRRYPHQLPQNVEEELLSIGAAEFQNSDIAPEVKAFWWPKFEKTVEWLIQTESEYRLHVAQVFSEVRGQMEWEAPAGKFTVEARADRVDVTSDGMVNIIDYKTGEPRKPKEVKAGYAPQLPIEGLIAQNGGFYDKEGKNLPPAEVARLLYWQLGVKSVEVSLENGKLLTDAEEKLKKLIHAFDFETTPYLARPNPKHLPKYSDYEHLARVKEWSVREDEDGEA